MSEEELWERAKCPFCETEGMPFLRVPNTRFDHGPREFSLVECGRCTLVFLDPVPQGEALSRYYEGGYYDGFVDSEPEETLPVRQGGWDGLRSVWRWRERRERKSKLEEKASRVKKYWSAAPGRLLELGCASGRFLELMRGRGWSVRGVEMSSTMCREARERRGLDVFEGRFEDVSFPPESFECVTLWSSLEHTLHPKLALERVRHLLVPGGVGIVLVPNVASLEFRIFGASWGHLDLPRHISQFNPRSLRNAIEGAGFTVLALHHQTRALTTTTEQRVARWLQSLWRARPPRKRPGSRLETLANVAAELVGEAVAVPVELAGVALRAGHNITVVFRR